MRIMKKEKSKRAKSTDDLCPVREFPCPQGQDTAAECQEQFENDFNPMQNLHDFELLRCANERAREREAQQED